MVLQDSFSQLLDTTVDQLKALRVQSEISRTKSCQSLLLVEGFIQALYELNKGSSGSSIRLDFLSGLVGERQQEQIVRLLVDSMRGAIDSECRAQVNDAAKELALALRPITDGLRDQLCVSVSDMRSSSLGLKTSLQSEVEDAKKQITLLNATQEVTSHALVQIQNTCKHLQSCLDQVQSDISTQVADSSDLRFNKLEIKQDELNKEFNGLVKSLDAFVGRGEVDDLKRVIDQQIVLVDECNKFTKSRCVEYSEIIANIERKMETAPQSNKDIDLLRDVCEQSSFQISEFEKTVVSNLDDQE